MKRFVLALVIVFSTQVCLAQNDTAIAAKSTGTAEHRNKYGIGCELRRTAACPGMFFVERRWVRQALSLTADIEIDSREYRQASRAGHYNSIVVKIGGIWKWYWLRSSVLFYTGFDPTYIHTRSTDDERDTVSADVYTTKGQGNECSISPLVGFEVPLRFTSNHIEIGMVARLIDAEMMSRRYDRWKNNIPFAPDDFPWYINSDFYLKIRTRATARIALKYIF
jgi:hypothetical protein